MRAPFLLCGALAILAFGSGALDAQAVHSADSLPSSARARGRAGEPVAPAAIRVRLAAHKGDFDYLLGDWEFDSNNRQYGKAHGYWSAARLAGHAQILDEFRIVGDSGQTYYVISTLRSYNALRDRWELVSVGNPNGLQDLGTGQRVGGEMHIEQSFGVGGSNPSRSRIRYYDIQPDRFSWNADCSLDGGKSWIRDCNHIEARRIGPARSLAPLAGGAAKPK